MATKVASLQYNGESCSNCGAEPQMGSAPLRRFTIEEAAMARQQVKRWNSTTPKFRKIGNYRVRPPRKPAQKTGDSYSK